MLLFLLLEMAGGFFSTDRWRIKEPASAVFCILIYTLYPRSVNCCHSRLLRFIPCPTVRPRSRKAPSIVLRALPDWVRFNRFTDKHALKWSAAPGLAKFSKCKAEKHWVAWTDQLPALPVSSQRGALDPSFHFKSFKKTPLHRRYRYILSANNRPYGTISNTRLWKQTLLKAACWFYQSNWKQTHTKRRITFSSSCLAHWFLSFIPKRNYAHKNFTLTDEQLHMSLRSKLFHFPFQTHSSILTHQVKTLILQLQFLYCQTGTSWLQRALYNHWQSCIKGTKKFLWNMNPGLRKKKKKK